MTDPFEEHLARAGGPRPLDPEFRERLEETISGPKPSVSGSGWKIDGPRELPSRLRSRLEAGMSAPPARSRSMKQFIAAAAVVALAAGATMVAIERLGSPPRETAQPGGIVSPSSVPLTPPSASRPKGSLQGFRAASAFLAYVRGEALQLVGPNGLDNYGAYYAGPFPGRVFAPAVGGGPGAGLGAPGGAPVPQSAPAPPPNSRPYSTTNIQEEGVDEPDIVKTDGHRLVVMSGSDIRILDVSGDRARLRGAVRILNGVGLFLAGDKILHLASLVQAPTDAARVTHAAYRPWTKVSVIDIRDPSRPRVVSSMSVEGNFVGARLARGVIRLIVQSGALGPAPVAFTGGPQQTVTVAEARNKAAIRTSSVGDWVPHFVVRRSGRATSSGHVHDWSAVSRPPDRGGVSMLTLLTIDPDDPRPNNASSVIGAGDIVYSSLDNLYVTTGRIDDILAARRGAAPKGPITRIHKFDIRDPARAAYRGSGVVPGFLLNQFSMSEHAGYLRVATTLQSPTGQGAPTSSVFVMRESAGKLIVAGSIGHLGVGERIFSVRFVGSKGYVVTFRLIDPLFVIDLRVPSRPRLAGQLKVPGYSGYLHPVSDTVLLGIGRDADSRGNLQGIQLSLFDVSNPQRPRRLDDIVASKNGSTDVENDHHSFLYWEPRRLAVVPVQLYGNNASERFFGALAVRIGSNSRFATPIRLSHSGRPNTDGADIAIHRSLVIGGRLITISNAGILLSDLTTLDARSWVPFQD